MTEKLTDILGREIKVGDKIVVLQIQGRNKGLVRREVSSLTPKMICYDERGYGVLVPAVRRAFPYNCVVYDADG